MIRRCDLLPQYRAYEREIDAAIHDAYGKALGLNCFRTYGPDFLSTDLGHYLGKEFAGETLDRYVLPEPKPRMPLYHLIGALDPLTPAEMKKAQDEFVAQQAKQKR